MLNCIEMFYTWKSVVSSGVPLTHFLNVLIIWTWARLLKQLKGLVWICSEWGGCFASSWHAFGFHFGFFRQPFSSYWYPESLLGVLCKGWGTKSDGNRSTLWKFQASGCIFNDCIEVPPDFLLHDLIFFRDVFCIDLCVCFHVYFNVFGYRYEISWFG